jgi:hypothetical protein
MVRELNSLLRDALLRRDILIASPYPRFGSREEWAFTLTLIAVSDEIKVHCRLGRQRETRRASHRASAPPQTTKQAPAGNG